MLRVLLKSRRKSNVHVLTNKQLEETYQQASKKIETLNKSLSDLEANRLSLDSLHELKNSSSLWVTVWIINWLRT